MKIGLVCPYNMFQFTGGVQEVIVSLQKHLIQRGHQVLIITPRPRSYHDKTPPGMILIGQSAKMNTFSTMVDASLEIDGDEIDTLINQENFDILHFHEPWQPFLLRQILSRSNAINIATFHASVPDNIMGKSVLNLVYPYTKSIQKYIHSYTAVSNVAAEYIRTLTDRPIAIVPNGIELADFKPPAKHQKHRQKTILFLGRLEKRKGLPYLVKAYAKLRENHRDIKLIIAGNGDKATGLKRYIEQNQIPDIKFTGFVPPSKKSALISSADLFCSPAIYGESFGIVLLEAMALGVPIVAGNNPGYAGVMTGFGAISLVTPTAINDFVQHLELLLYDNDARTYWQKWAKQEIVKYDFNKVAIAYENIYKQALKKYAKN